MKPDADAIRQWVAGLPALFGADTSRAWWAKFAFRFDTMPSVAAILRSGCLLSRQECAHRGITHHDAANQSVIEKTAHAHDLVRLYFRPCTPTQYNMEGIKAAQELAARQRPPAQNATRETEIMIGVSFGATRNKPGRRRRTR